MIVRVSGDNGSRSAYLYEKVLDVLAALYPIEALICAPVSRSGSWAKSKGIKIIDQYGKDGGAVSQIDVFAISDDYVTFSVKSMRNQTPTERALDDEIPF